MQKQAPSIGRILVAAGFTLSCFGLILFLWVAFGGPVPLKPKSYRFTAYFPEATQLAVESDVRIGGVSVGKVKAVELAPPDQRVEGYDTTEAEIEIKPEFAPISTDARAILRQKTLLGETYIELTPGTEPEDQNAAISLGAAANVTDAEADGRRAARGGRHARGRADSQRRPDRRDLQRARPGDAPGVPALAGERLDRDQRPRPRPERHLRQPRAVRDRRLADPGRAQPAEGRAEGARPRHRRGVRGPVRARRPARRGDRRRRGDLRRARRLGRGPGRDVPDPAHVPARDAGDARRRSTTTSSSARRCCRSCCRSRTTSAPRSRACASSRRTWRTSSATSIR